MITYTMILAPEAKADINDLRHYITEELGLPLTADKYIEGIYDTIRKLSYLGDSLAISQREYIQRFYGPAARTIIYKKMTIIYNVTGHVVLIRRVIASKLVQ